MKWYLEVLKKYAVFSGRARRTEFWMFTLIDIIIMILLSVIDGLLGSLGIICLIYKHGNDSEQVTNKGVT